MSLRAAGIFQTPGQSSMLLTLLCRAAVPCGCGRVVASNRVTEVTKLAKEDWRLLVSRVAGKTIDGTTTRKLRWDQIPSYEGSGE